MRNQRRSMPSLIDQVKHAREGALENANFAIDGKRRGFIIYGTKDNLVNMGDGDYKILYIKNKVLKEIKSEVAAVTNNTVSANGNLDINHFKNFIGAVRGENELTSPVDE